MTPKDSVWEPLDLTSQTTPPWCFFLKKYPQITQVLQLETEHEFPFGFYRVQGRAFDWLVKFITPLQAERHLQANDVNLFLQDKFLNVSCLLDGFPIFVSDEIAILAVDFKDSKQAKPKDLSSLAIEIGKLHSALKTWHAKDEVKRQAQIREERLKKTWQKIRDESLKNLGTIPDEVIAILKKHPLDFSVLTHDAQVVHGDLNMGNILFQDDEQVCFLDFEDTCTAWFSPLTELSFVIERFLLIDEKPSNELVEEGALFLKSYPHSLYFSSNKLLVEILQTLAIRAMLLLVELVYTKQAVAQSEWQKFIFLYQLPKNKQPELEEIVERYRA